ncbi:hypothetical protein [Okeania sp.]|nr:hypothetical protein [Okeania sp.]
MNNFKILSLFLKFANISLPRSVAGINSAPANASNFSCSSLDSC